MSQKNISLTLKSFCVNFSLELKEIILSHPVTSKQPQIIVLMRHPVLGGLRLLFLPNVPGAAFIPPFSPPTSIQDFSKILLYTKYNFMFFFSKFTLHLVMLQQK